MQKSIDRVDSSFNPVSDLDKSVMSTCKSIFSRCPLPKLFVNAAWSSCVCLRGWILENPADDRVTDDPEIYDGAHVGLQLVGRRLQEEKVLAMTEYVARLLNTQSAKSHL